MNRLREARTDRGWSQFELAKRSNVRPNEISLIENGKIFPYPGWRIRLAEALGVPEHELFPAVEGANRREA